MALIALCCQNIMAVLPYSDVFPANFANGIPTGWAFMHDSSTEQVAGGIKVTCSQTAPKYRADLKYNMSGEYNNNANRYFTLNASEYKIFAIKFIGTRPQSGSLKLSNISADGSWIKGTEGYSLNESRWTEIKDLDGNSTYYWTIGGEKWTGELTINRIEIVIADITNDADKSYTVANINWFPSVEALEATLNLKQETAVVNQTTNKGYADIVAALDAVNENETLVVNENQSISTRLNVGKKGVTIKGASQDIKITRTNAGNMMFLCNNNGSLTIENITLDGDNRNSDKNFTEASGGGAITFNNVIVANAISTNNQGLLVAKNNGKMVLNGVKMENCTVNEGRGEVFFGTGTNVLSGDNSFSLCIENYSFTVGGTLGNTTPITIYDSNKSFANDRVLVIGCTDPAKFELANSDLKLEAKDGNLVMVDPSTTGIDDIVAGDDTAPVYYNLQGVRVDNPENGMFIKVQGGKTSKVIIR